MSSSDDVDDRSNNPAAPQPQPPPLPPNKRAYPFAGDGTGVDDADDGRPLPKLTVDRVAARDAASDLDLLACLTGGPPSASGLAGSAAPLSTGDDGFEPAPDRPPQLIHSKIRGTAGEVRRPRVGEAFQARRGRGRWVVALSLFPSLSLSLLSLSV